MSNQIARFAIKEGSQLSRDRIIERISGIMAKRLDNINDLEYVITALPTDKSTIIIQVNQSACI